MSDTPRTDAAEFPADEASMHDSITALVVPAEFARELEREAADALERAERAEASLRESARAGDGQSMESVEYHDMLDRLWKLVKPRDGLPCDVILAQENAALREDKERLDWLEKVASYADLDDRSLEWRRSPEDGYATLREAIDASRQKALSSHS